MYAIEVKQLLRIRIALLKVKVHSETCFKKKKQRGKKVRH